MVRRRVTPPANLLGSRLAPLPDAGPVAAVLFVVAAIGGTDDQAAVSRPSHDFDDFTVNALKANDGPFKAVASVRDTLLSVAVTAWVRGICHNMVTPRLKFIAK